MTYVALVVVFTAFLLYREHQHATERVLLLNRIQAPSLAVAESLPEPDGTPAHIPPDDDQAWTQYVEDRRVGALE